MKTIAGTNITYATRLFLSLCVCVSMMAFGSEPDKKLSTNLLISIFRKSCGATRDVADYCVTKHPYVTTVGVTIAVYTPVLLYGMNRQSVSSTTVPVNKSSAQPQPERLSSTTTQSELLKPSPIAQPTLGKETLTTSASDGVRPSGTLAPDGQPKLITPQQSPAPSAGKMGFLAQCIITNVPGLAIASALSTAAVWAYRADVTRRLRNIQSTIDNNHTVVTGQLDTLGKRVIKNELNAKNRHTATTQQLNTLGRGLEATNAQATNYQAQTNQNFAKNQEAIGKVEQGVSSLNGQLKESEKQAALRAQEAETRAQERQKNNEAANLQFRQAQTNTDITLGRLQGDVAAHKRETEAGFKGLTTTVMQAKGDIITAQNQGFAQQKEWYEERFETGDEEHRQLAEKTVLELGTLRSRTETLEKTVGNLEGSVRELSSQVAVGGAQMNAKLDELLTIARPMRPRSSSSKPKARSSSPQARPNASRLLQVLNQNNPRQCFVQQNVNSSTFGKSGLDSGKAFDDEVD